MSYSVIATDHFKKEAKKLSKKYRSLKEDLDLLGKSLEDNPIKGVSLGHNLYKVRLAIASKGKGKSGGARVITLVKKVKKKIYLVSIYDKAKFDNLSKHHITELIEKTGLKQNMNVSILNAPNLTIEGLVLLRPQLANRICTSLRHV